MGYNMKAKIIIGALCLMTFSAHADMPYRVEQLVMYRDGVGGNDREAFAREHRMYVGAMYDFSMWQSFTDKNNLYVGGKNTSSFEVVAGLRVYDTFRVEANYARTIAEFDDIKMEGNTLFLNAIVDARIDSMYRLFRTQHLIPYVGAGVGLTGNKVKDDTVKINDKLSGTLAAMAGLSIELGEYFAIDAGYRYIYMFSPKFEGIQGFAPTAHQFRVGARVNF